MLSRLSRPIIRRPRPRRRCSNHSAKNRVDILILGFPDLVSNGYDPYEAPWRQFALCRGRDPDLWFPVESDGAEAVAICLVCPVRHDCLDWAMEHNERNGIWGGVSARKRQRMRAERRRIANGGAVVSPVHLVSGNPRPSVGAVDGDRADTFCAQPDIEPSQT
jgi:WhiB family transcriptional regulator, redox-sensing transcriptional regulator